MFAVGSLYFFILYLLKGNNQTSWVPY